MELERMSDDAQKIYDVAVIGGGLAGLSAAIRAAQSGLSVVVFEKKSFPRHKVCGEYVSNEVLPIFDEFGLDPFEFGATQIQHFQLTAPSGKSVTAELPLGAFGLSRFKLDALLARKAKDAGVHLIDHTKVRHIEMLDDLFEIAAGQKRFVARYAIGAFGKGSNFSKQSRQYQKDRGRYVAVKRHVNLDFPDDLVALHNFSGGYCGVSMVEEGHINICYLAKSSDLHDSGSIAQFERDILWQNPHLKAVLAHSTDLFDQPLAISNFTFGAKKPIENHVIMAGDAAGMISPLCGNGMAMAIRSGFHLGNQLVEALNTGKHRKDVEKQYSRDWKNEFSTRLWWGNRLQTVFGRPAISNTALSILSRWPSITPKIIEKTHGHPVLI